MSSTTKKPPISKKSQEYADSLLTTDDEYRNLDRYLRANQEQLNIKKRRLAREIASEGEIHLREIEEKNRERETRRMQMVEFIYTNSKETFITLKELKDLPFDDVAPIYSKVKEWKKPWWQRAVNIFR
jgi:hypothetical protein